MIYVDGVWNSNHLAFRGPEIQGFQKDNVIFNFPTWQPRGCLRHNILYSTYDSIYSIRGNNGRHISEALEDICNYIIMRKISNEFDSFDVLQIFVS